VEGIGWTRELTGDVAPVRLLGCIPWGGRAIRDFQLDPHTPLTWLGPDGDAWQPCRYIRDCDGASIPRAVQWLPDYQSDRWLWPLLHDSGYRDVPGYGHGLWHRTTPESAWCFVRMTREEVDRLCIRIMGASEGMRATQISAVFRAVRLFGRRW